VKDQRLRVARLIEDDYAEPRVGRARRFFEDQKSLMPKDRELGGAAPAAVLFLLPFLAPAAAATKTVEAVQRVRQRVLLGRRLRQALALARELEQYRSARGRPSAGPYRTGHGAAIAGLSPDGELLVARAEAAFLVRYWIDAPLEWRWRVISGVALAAGGSSEWKLIVNAYTDRNDRPIRKALPVLKQAVEQLTPLSCPFETWRWQLGDLDSSFRSMA
jgi:hypothetical protein